MHLGFFLIGLLAGGTAAVAVFGHDGSLLWAMLAYSICSMGSVFFAAIVWALAPSLHIARAPPTHPL